MKPLHAKSPCCQGKIYKFGSRRRKCIECGKTWRIRQKRKGRKKIRTSLRIIESYLSGQRLSSRLLSLRYNLSEDQLDRRLRTSLVQFVKQKSWPLLPSESKLIAIADAMMQKVEGKTYTIYFVLTRKIDSGIAAIAKPTILEGKENNEGWYVTFGNLDQKTSRSICALVCDGQRGLVYLAKINGWIIQRCHFHLLAAIQGRRSRSRFSRHQGMGNLLYQTVSRIITGKGSASDLERVREIAKTSESQVLRKVLKGFIKHHGDYQSYYKFPDLHLPRTSNSAESLVNSVRSLLRKTRGLRTKKSFLLWIYAFVKHKKSIACNGSYTPT